MLFAQLASQAGFRLLPEVCKSAAGFYIGTQTEDGPVSRESVEYWRTSFDAEEALYSNRWTQRPHP